MIAVDTNVVVRLLTGDHPKQAAAARSLRATRAGATAVSDMPVKE